MKAKVKEVDSKEEPSKETTEEDIDEREVESEEVSEKEIFDKKGSCFMCYCLLLSMDRCYAGEIAIPNCTTPDRYV